MQKSNLKIQNKTRLNVAHAYVQDGSGGKVVILGGDRPSHFEKNVPVDVCVILNGNRNRVTNTKEM